MKIRLVSMVALLLFGVSACNARIEPSRTRRAATSTQPAAPAFKASSVTEVTDPSQVCMVNDQFMGRPQILVPVAGKNYYGCCEMCKGRLERDGATRTAADPVSGRAVDKASAVIGMTDTGRVLYFESRDSLAAYRSK